MRRPEVSWTAAFLSSAHEHSFKNRAEIARSHLCACFHCLNTYPASEVTDWTGDENGVGQTALCPRCPVDSVLGDASRLPLEPGFLRAMRVRFFETL
jgi:hypothetical protein